MATAAAALPAAEAPKPSTKLLPEEDIITRIQHHLDQLATQIYASARYVSTHHPLIDFDGTPLDSTTNLPLGQAAQQASTPAPGATPGPTNNATEAESALTEKKSKKDKKDKSAKDDAEGAEPAIKPPLSPTWTPIDPEPFNLDVTELANDLIMKQKQIEELLHLLPPELEKEEEKQEARIRELVMELEALEDGILQARQDRDVLLQRVDNIIGAIGRRGGI